MYDITGPVTRDVSVGFDFIIRFRFRLQENLRGCLTPSPFFPTIVPMVYSPVVLSEVSVGRSERTLSPDLLQPPSSYWLVGLKGL